MKIRLLAAVIAASTVPFVAAEVACGGSAFKDPAPPRPRSESSSTPSKPPTQPKGLRFRRAPRPLAPNAVTHEWRDFLGPQHNAVSNERPLLRKFVGGGPALVWEIDRGEGYAGPCVTGGRVILFHRRGNQEIVQCLDAENGRQYWSVASPTNFEDRYGFSGGPRCQPVSDGQRVYTFGAGGTLQCISLRTGEVLWRREILREFRLQQNFFGVGSTPLLEGPYLIVNVGAERGPCVAAFDRLTGRMAWGAGKEWGPSYASPIPATVHGRRRVFCFAGGESRPSTGGLLCIDPANGKVEFQFPWRARRYESVNASSPVIVGNQVYISECYGQGGALLTLLPGAGFKQAWTSEALNTHILTAVHKDGYLYGIDGHGPQNAPLVCQDLKTGKEMWRLEPEWVDRVKTPFGVREVSRGPGLASLMLADGQGLLMSEYGHLVWMDLNPKGYRELHRARLFSSSEAWSMPALSRGLLYVCQNSPTLDEIGPRLLCYDLRGP